MFRLSSQVTKPHDGSSPLEVVLWADIRPSKSRKGQTSLGLSVHEFGQQGRRSECEGVGKHLNPFGTDHGDIRDHPMYRYCCCFKRNVHQSKNSAGTVADPGGGGLRGLQPPLKFRTTYSYNIVFLIITRGLWVLPNS